MDIHTLTLATSIVALAEIGDKTQLLSLMLATRFKGHHWPIILGILISTLVNHALAAFVGSTISNLINPEIMRWVLGLGFIGLGIWLLVPDQLDSENKIPPIKSSWKIFTLTSTLFFFAEMGDKTQIATIALGAKYSDLTAVVTGTTIGMLLANGPAVWLGSKFTHWFPTKWIHLIAALLFVAIGFGTLII